MKQSEISKKAFRGEESKKNTKEEKCEHVAPKRMNKGKKRGRVEARTFLLHSTYTRFQDEEAKLIGAGEKGKRGAFASKEVTMRKKRAMRNDCVGETNRKRNQKAQALNNKELRGKRRKAILVPQKSIVRSQLNERKKKSLRKREKGIGKRKERSVEGGGGKRKSRSVGSEGMSRDTLPRWSFIGERSRGAKHASILKGQGRRASDRRARVMMFLLEETSLYGMLSRGVTVREERRARGNLSL